MARFVAYDAWGTRIDRIEVDADFTGLVAAGRALLTLPRLAQARMIPKIGAAAAPVLAATDAMACLLRRDDPVLWRRFGRRLAPEGGLTVTLLAHGGIVARGDHDGSFALFGMVPFAPIAADLALVPARGEGGDASLFLLELKQPDGGWNGIAIRRLRETMGLHALPVAELELHGAWSVAVGGTGAGEAKMAYAMLIARHWAIHAAVGGVGSLLEMARDFARRPRAGGEPHASEPVHRAWIARMAAEYEAMLALALESAAALERAEAGGDEEMARLWVSLAAFACRRGAVAVASELLESFDGVGVREDSSVPDTVRDLHAPWGGTGSALAREVAVALADLRGLGASWLAEVEARLGAVTHKNLEWVRPRVEAACKALRPMVLEPDVRDARRICAGMARVAQAALLAEVAERRLGEAEDRSGLLAAEIVTRESLLPGALVDMDVQALAFPQARA